MKCMSVVDSLSIKSCLTPAGADEHPLKGGGVGDGAVVVDKGRVKGHTIHIQGH